MKKVLIFILLIATATALYFGYLKMDELSEQKTHPTTAIAPDVTIIIEANNFSSFWNRFSETSILWSSLKKMNWLSQIDSTLSKFDKELEQLPKLDARLNGTPICLGIFTSGESGYDFVLSMNITKRMEKQELALLWTAIEMTPSSTSKHESCTIQEYTFNGNSFFAAERNDISLLSSSLTQIQRAIHQLSEENTINTNQNFQKIYATATSDSEINVYVHPNGFNKLLSRIASKEIKTHFNEINNTANWSELDFTSRAGNFSFSGFSLLDSTKSILSVYREEQPQFLSIIDALPANTNAFIWHGYELFDRMEKNTVKTKDELNERSTMNSILEIDAINDFNAWIDNQHAVFWINGITEPNIVCRNNGAVDPLSRLSNLLVSDSTFSLFNETKIYPLKTEFNPEVVFGDEAKMKQCIFIQGSEYSYFCPSITAAKQIISAINAQRNLSNSDDFMAFYSKNFSAKSNYFLYAHQPFGNESITRLLNHSALQELQNNQEAFNGIQHGGWQISSNAHNLVYHNIHLGFTAKKASNPTTTHGELWEIDLDTNAARQPQFVKNHRTKTREILIQDQANDLYLISATGEIKWKKKIDNEIIGHVKQIDVYANGKFQMLFNTRNKIYLLDINGNHVKGFPVNLPSFASNEVSVLDYDKNHNYRLLIAGENKRIYNYDKNGALVEGWKFGAAKSQVLGDITHFSIGNKDYICFNDESGNIYVLDRQGNERHQVNQTIPTGFMSAELFKGKSILSTKYVYKDSTNQLYQLNFNSEFSALQIDSSITQYSYSRIDYDGDKFHDHMLVKPQKIEVYGPDLSMLKRIQYNSGSKVDYFYLNGEHYFSVKQGKEITIIDQFGDALSGYPKSSDVSPIISDMNNDGSNDIILLTGKTVKAQNFN